MKKLFTIAPLLLSVCLASSIHAEIPVELVGQWGGDCTAAVVRDHYAYIGLGLSVVILDISEPASPARIGHVNLPDFVHSVVVNGHYVYVADGSAGLAVIDISSPSAPVYLGGYDTSNDVEGVTVSGKYAYITVGPTGLQILDISSPSEPILVGEYDTRGSAEDVVVSDNYAYVACGWGFEIIDISNPMKPVLVGEYDTVGHCEGIVVSGSYAYVVGQHVSLEIIDISTPSACVYVGGYDLGYAWGADIYGSYICVADNSAGLVMLRVSWQGDLAPPDGDVDLGDLAQFAAHWLEKGCIRPEGCNGADLDNDTDVDFADLSIMAANWLKLPGPPPQPPQPPKGRGCFLGNTPVWVDGELVQISSVVSGQMVSQHHGAPAISCFGQIEKVEEHEGAFECRDIVLESGNRISVVDAHCFMLDSGGWIAAHDLKCDLRLKTLSGTVGIKSVTTRALPFVGKVYNLKVEGANRYLVGKDGVIVRDY